MSSFYIDRLSKQFVVCVSFGIYLNIYRLARIGAPSLCDWHTKSSDLMFHNSETSLIPNPWFEKGVYPAFLL